MTQPSDANGEVLLETVGLSRKAADLWLLKNITLRVARGNRIALVGPSGGGKTLLLRALALLDASDAGQILWRGKPVRGRQTVQFRSRVMYLHQRPTLLEGNVEHNLRQPFGLAIHRHKPFQRQRIVALLNSLDRDESFLRKQQRDLSGGEAQLTALLRAMQLDPDLLLLDEPTSALDAAAAGMVESLVSNWLREQPGQRATVWVSHDLEQARRVADLLWRLRDGQLEGDD